MYSNYWIAFDGAGSWNIGNGFGKIVVIFGVDGSSSTHADNRKNNFGESRTYGINGSFASPEKKVSINFSKAKKKFVWVYIIKVIIVICLLLQKYLSLKPTIKILIVQLSFP